MKNNKNLRVLAQAFYGNRTETDVNLENLDKFILGYVDNSISVTEKIDRTIISIPNTNIVVVYNKYQEKEELDRKKDLLERKNYELKPLVVIPEDNIKIYSRCIVCRISEDGKLEDLQNEDYEKIEKYLAE